MADTSPASKPPVVRPVAVVPSLAWRPTVSAAAPVVARPMGMVSAQFQPLSRPMGPTVHANWGPVGTVSPPQTSNLAARYFPRRPTMAPPHAGNFRLGGPDALPGAGIGALPFPIPGDDGYRRWMPEEDAAKRSEDSDLDAHRPSMALRVPSMGIEGDVGAAEPPLPPAPAWIPMRLSVPQAIASPLSPAAVAPPAHAPSPSPPKVTLAPPTGPWDRGVMAAAPPAVPGAPADAAVMAPPGSGAAMRPGQDEIQAFKAAMRGANPADAWRPPKPSAQGAPGGGRGGRGGGISGYVGQAMSLQSTMKAAAALERQAQDSINVHTMGPGLAQMVGENVGVGESPYSTHGMSLDEARKALAEAQKSRMEAEKKLASLQKAGGSQVDRRALEELARQEDQADWRAEQADRENERESKKYDTKPNYSNGAFGDSTMKEARDIRGRANENQAAAGRLGGHADPKAIQAAKKASREAKQAAKAAKKAGQDAKNAAKYGTKLEAFRAAERADALAKAARKALGEADEKLKKAEDSARPQPVAPPDGGTGGSSGGPEGRTPVATVPDNAHVCGNPNPGCDAVELDCSTWPGTRRVCRYVLVPVEDGGDDGGRKKDPVESSKGRGMEKPGNTTGSTPDANPLSSEQPGPHPFTDGTLGFNGQPVSPDSAPPGEAPLARLASGLVPPTYAELEAAAKKAVADLLRARNEVDKKIVNLTVKGLHILDRHNRILSAWERRAGLKIPEGWLSEWERRALQKVEEGLEILTDARSELTLRIVETYLDLEGGLGARGQEKEDYLESINARSWQAPAEVNARTKKRQATLDGRLPDEPFKAESLLQDWYFGLKNEDDRTRALSKMLAAGRVDLNEATRDYATWLPGMVGNALDTVTGRLLRVGVLALRDGIHGSMGARGGIWSRSAMGEFSREIINQYTAGLETGQIEPWQAVLAEAVVKTAEIGSDVVATAAIAGTAGAVASARAGTNSAIEAEAAALRTPIGSRLSARSGIGGIVPPGSAAEETATFLRAMGPRELAKFRRTGVLESHAERLGVDAERGFLSWFKHSRDSLIPPSPYKSMTTMPHIAEEWARKMGGQVVRITVPKSEVIKGLNVWQAEYLVPGGTRVLTFRVGTSLPLPSFGATARWAGETSVAVGGLAYGETKAVLWVADSIRDSNQ